jgi:hypothetical protein
MDKMEDNRWLIGEILAREITAKEIYIMRSVQVHICIKAVSLPSVVFLNAVH